MLWLFTDAARLPDPLPAIARLPRGLCGVVFRHDGAPARLALGLAIARLCRERRLWLVVAGDARLAARLHAGWHMRGGRMLAPRRHPDRATASAHNAADLRRARRAGAALAFLSPVFATASHSGAAGLGVARWAALAQRGGLAVAALGGIDGRSARRLPRRVCAGVGAIGALA